jgi:glycerol-3-phosphate dehydrogenase
MWMYDLTGGVRIGKLHKRLSKEEPSHMPTMPVERLASAYTSTTARTPDARLTLTIADGSRQGAAVANRVTPAWRRTRAER